MVAERLARHHTPFTTVDEHWYRVEAVCSSVPVHAIQSLFDSIPKRGHSNESGIVVIPQFEDKDDCAYLYSGLKVLGMHAISSDPAGCVCDKVAAR
ncbi:hypothetical protein TNCV_3650401 [Trichonephila clavipes]|uniref:Uncharacterized protein n=1 Tax=Trichonephila clavipes TaxID=2585209 RepID=A0A8X6SIE2_TRICX|nr:hypothetical protein TNCV_3650401 [Trichonephila clavipes]